MLAVRTDRFGMGGKESWAVFSSLEPFIPITNSRDRIIDNSYRWDIALSYQATKKTRLELHYIHQSTEIFSSDDSTIIENIFRLRVFHRL